MGPLITACITSDKSQVANSSTFIWGGNLNLLKIQRVSAFLSLSLLWAFLLGSPLGTQAETKSTGVLPKNIRTMIYKQITTSFVDKFDNTGKQTPYTSVANIELTAERIASIDPAINNLISSAESLEPGITSGLSFGKTDVQGNVDVDVRVVGFGWGLSDKLTWFAAAPFWKAKVNLKSVEFTEQNLTKTQFVNNLRTIVQRLEAKMQALESQWSQITPEQQNWVLQTKQLIDKYDETQLQKHTATAMAQLSQHLPDVRISTLHRVITDLGYQPLGTWEGSGIGDVESGLKWKFHDKETLGSLLELGVRAPTGRVDDQDLIQDVPFGDGQWDVWSSLSADVKPTPWLRINQTVTAEMQLPSQQEMRTPKSADDPLTDEKQQVRFDLGDKLRTETSLNLPFFWRFSWGATYMREWKQQDKYTLLDGTTQEFLESETKRIKEVVGLEFLYSSVDDFTKGSALLPMMAWINFEKTVSGINVPANDVVSFSVQFFF